MIMSRPLRPFEPSLATQSTAMMENKKLRRKEKAAVTIQRMMKGHCARADFERKKLWQSRLTVRGFLTRKRVHEDSRQRVKL
uniref:39S ribosomal protein L52, mitochondrial n=1 Tax=Macrostomum lignano TaxID=282301 RepID=A0A1I8F9F5_9PLAT